VRCLFAGHEDIDRLIVLPSAGSRDDAPPLVRAEALADLLVECRYVDPVQPRNRAAQA